jgi:hypothetical protein
MYINFYYNRYQYETPYHMYMLQAETSKTKKLPRVFIEKDSNTRIYTAVEDYNDDVSISNKYMITNRFDYYIKNKTYTRYVPSFIISQLEKKEIADNSACRLDISIMLSPRYIYEYVDDIDKITTVFDKVYIDFTSCSADMYKKYYKIWTGKVTNDELPPITTDKLYIRYYDSAGNIVPSWAYSNFWINPNKWLRDNALFLHAFDNYMLANNIDSSKYYYIVGKDPIIDSYFNNISSLLDCPIIKVNDVISYIEIFAEKIFDYNNIISKILYDTLQNIDTDIFDKCTTFDDVKTLFWSYK